MSDYANVLERYKSEVEIVEEHMEKAKTFATTFYRHTTVEPIEMYLYTLIQWKEACAWAIDALNTAKTHTSSLPPDGAEATSVSELHHATMEKIDDIKESLNDVETSMEDSLRRLRSQT